MTTINEAIKQLERSERGQATCKLLHDFLDSPTVKFLDNENQQAVAILVSTWMLGNGLDAREVMGALSGVLERNKWLTQTATNEA